MVGKTARQAVTTCSISGYLANVNPLGREASPTTLRWVISASRRRRPSTDPAAGSLPMAPNCGAGKPASILTSRTVLGYKPPFQRNLPFSFGISGHETATARPRGLPGPQPLARYNHCPTVDEPRSSPGRSNRCRPRWRSDTRSSNDQSDTDDPFGSQPKGQNRSAQRPTGYRARRSQASNPAAPRRRTRAGRRRPAPRRIRGPDGGYSEAHGRSGRKRAPCAPKVFRAGQRQFMVDPDWRWGSGDPAVLQSETVGETSNSSSHPGCARTLFLQARPRANSVSRSTVSWCSWDSFLVPPYLLPARLDRMATVQSIAAHTRVQHLGSEPLP